MRNDYERFRLADGKVAVVTMGSPQQAADFREKKRLPFPCLSDPEQNLYRAFHLPRAGFGQMAAPAVMLAGPKALFRGGLGVPRGDIKQMPGTFVIDRDGIIRLAYYSTNIADNPANDRLIEVLESLQAKE